MNLLKSYRKHKQIHGTAPMWFQIIYIPIIFGIFAGGFMFLGHIIL